MLVLCFIIAIPLEAWEFFLKQWKEIKQLLKRKENRLSAVFTQIKHEIELVTTAIQEVVCKYYLIGGRPITSCGKPEIMPKVCKNF
jgi:hypothetical protein